MEYGCIGERLGHSFSKIIHNEFCDYNYELKELAKDELDVFMRKADFKAINVTIPYKKDVIPYLFFIDENAKKIGAVNTIINKDGRLFGYNTDFYGLSSLINKRGVSLKGKKVLILGSGGTSATAFAVAETMGASQILKVSRTVSDNSISYCEAIKLHSDTEVIINTTPCGMFPEIDNKAIELSSFKNLEAVFDAVYNPLHSQLVVEARKRGIIAEGGLYMLVCQAAAAAEKFIDTVISGDEIDRVYNKLLLSKKNLVLIGMPGCGKSTISKALAKQLDMDLIDIDDEIVKTDGRPIPQIFSESGEEAFRDIEADVIAKSALKQRCIIATGGGAILRAKNIDLLKGNGIVVFIDRPLELLVTSLDRPLSSNKEALKRRYNERYEKYLSSADRRVDACGTLEENINCVKEVFLDENFGY